MSLFIGRRKRALQYFFIGIGDGSFFRQSKPRWWSLDTACQGSRPIGAGRRSSRQRVYPRTGNGRSVDMKHLGLLTAVSLVALASVSSQASAQQKTLYVAGYGGS